ncbi:MAG: hypothetical protein IRZ33_09475 [Alicyclobacillaceae bacterium]|nr:hypothetical protein [Alicyclobacillaceae bacterium]
MWQWLSGPTLAHLLLGAVAGAIGMTVWQGRELNRLSLQLSSLRMQYEELEEENVQLSAQLQAPSPVLVLKTVHIAADAPDAMSQLEVVRFARQQLGFLVGRPIRVLVEHPELPAHLLNGQLVEAGGQSLVLRVTTTVIAGETLSLRVTALPRKS